MRTTKPISTISFNSSDFLYQKLMELVNAKRISFFAFIRHKPEDDEGGKKFHHHVYCEPSKMLQTDDLRDELKEFDPEHPDKPKTCLTWKSSKFDDWYMYSIHDKRYLAQKQQSRKYQYQDCDFYASDFDDLNAKVKSIDLLNLSPYSDMLNAIENGVEWCEYFSRGTVPIPQIRQFQEAFLLLQATATHRNGRNTHSPTCDSNGEVIEASVSDENAKTFDAVTYTGVTPWD